MKHQPQERALSEIIQHYLSSRTEKKSHSEEEQKLSINEAIGAIAFYYEKIRNIVDYQDEHLLRQNAIKRILGRRLIFQESMDELAHALIKELIRSRYFPNNVLPISIVKEIEQILVMYAGIIEALRKRRILTDKDQDWLLSMAACAIDEHFVPMTEEEALVTLMYEMLEEHVEGSFADVDEKLRKSQIYIAAYRVLLRPDVTRLRYFLLKHSFKHWTRFSGPDIEKLASEYPDVSKKIDFHIKHPLNKKLMPTFRRHRIPFVVLHTIIKNNGEEILKNKEVLQKEIKRICEGFYAVQRRRLYSRTVRAFIYIFLTKMVLGLSLELPYDLLTIHAINTTPLLINILFPPVLLAMITLSVRFPNEENTKLIAKAIDEIAFAENTKREIFVPQRYSVKRKSPVLYIIFSILYVALFAVSFGALTWLLEKFDFNIVSGTIFVVFVCLITFFGVTLRRSVQELMIVRKKPGLIATFFDLFTLPIVQVGRWLSFNISRVNVFVFIFDILIELPLQALIEITEEWFAFIKEKKEEME
ncbi:MAG: hypothetical protein Q7R79_00745 [bacterium]|nr:hypothetical protein [bacterium]